MTKVAQGTPLTKTEGHASNWEPVALNNVLPPTSGSVSLATLVTPTQ